MKVLLWFRRDLRIHDHVLLHKAQQINAQYLGFAQAHLKSSFENTGEPRWGERKKQFYLETISDLKSSFESKGLPFWFSDLPLSKAIETVEEQFIPDEIWCQNAAGWEEREEVLMLAKKYKLREMESQSLYSLEDLPFKLESLPFIFTDFRKKVEKHSEVRQCYSTEIQFSGAQNIQTPELPELSFLPIHPHSAFPFAGGERAALERMKDWIWEGNHLSTYKKTRNESIGTEYSSKLSAYLAWGCLSPRTLYWEIKKYEREVLSNESTYWLYFELLWRDFFHFTCRKEGSSFFKSKNIEKQIDQSKWMAWKEAKTNNSFINAHMKELAETGFMSNRGRQNVASFLLHSLKIDWRLGAQYFESELIDFEPANNYGNWTYLAGLGHDPRPNRIFNPEIQKQRYDAEGKYVELWT